MDGLGYYNNPDEPIGKIYNIKDFIGKSQIDKDGNIMNSTIDISNFEIEEVIQAHEFPHLYINGSILQKGDEKYYVKF